MPRVRAKIRGTRLAVHLTGLGARDATVDSRSPLDLTPSMKHTSAPILAANLSLKTASSIPKT